jgi:hypothetical protein
MPKVRLKTSAIVDCSRGPEGDLKQLLFWSRRLKTVQALVLRAWMISLSADGLNNAGGRTTRVHQPHTGGQWRQRCVEQGIDGLLDDAAARLAAQAWRRGCGARVVPNAGIDASRCHAPVDALFGQAVRAQPHHYPAAAGLPSARGSVSPSHPPPHHGSTWSKSGSPPSPKSRSGKACIDPLMRWNRP